MKIDGDVIIRLLELHHKINRIAKRKARFKKGWEICLCPKSRQRLAYDHHIATVELTKAQNMYRLLIDFAVNSEELEDFLVSQRL